MAQYTVVFNAKKRGFYVVMIKVVAVLYGELGGGEIVHAAGVSSLESPTYSAAMERMLPQKGRPILEENSVEALKIRLAEQSLKADIAAHKAKMAGVEDTLKHQEEGLVSEQKGLDAQWGLLKRKITMAAAQKGLFRRETERSVTRLAHIYEQMPPREAADRFNILDMHAILPVAQHMLPRKLSDIMAKMAPERASSLLQYLAGRRLIANGQSQ